MEYIRIKRDTEITPKVVAKKVMEYQADQENRLLRLHNLYHYTGVLDEEMYKDGLRKISIERLSFPIARYISTIRTNYILGKPIKYEASQDAEGGVEGMLEEVRKAYRRQSKHRLDKELKRECSQVGFAYELTYLAPKTTNNKTEVVVKSCMLPSESTFVVFDDTVERDSVFAVTWIKPSDDLPYTVTVYTDITVTEYTAGNVTHADSYSEGVVTPHYFGRVPVTMWQNNDECIGDYEDVAPLIQALNGIMTDSRYDIKKCVDGLLVFVNTRLAGASIEEKAKVRQAMRDLGILEIRDDEENPGAKADVKTLSSPINYASADVFIDRVWRAIFTLTGVPDPLRTEYFTSLSGVALKMQMFLGLRPFAQDGEANIEYALRRRLKMYLAGNAITSNTSNIDIADLDIVFTYTEPSNDLETAQIISYLYGKPLVGNETLSKQLSFVEDAKAEVEQAKADNAAPSNADILSQLSMFGGNETATNPTPNNGETLQ